MTWRTKIENTHIIVLLLFWNLSGTTRLSRHKKGKKEEVKTNLDLLEQEIGKCTVRSQVMWLDYKNRLHITRCFINLRRQIIAHVNRQKWTQTRVKCA